MFALEILITVSTIGFLLILWLIVGMRHLSNLQKLVKEQWEVVDESVRLRHNLLPNLIETVRNFDSGQEELLEKLINERMRAAKEYFSGMKKIEYEHDLSGTINNVIDFGKKQGELGKSTNFLEIKKDISDTELDIVTRSKKFNEMVRSYNKSRNSFFMLPISAIFGFKSMNIFEVEI